MAFNKMAAAKQLGVQMQPIHESLFELHSGRRAQGPFIN